MTNKIKEAVTLINGRWVDANNNSWSAELETKESAIEKSKTLINCSGCSDCSYCKGCSYCRDCSDCSDCSYCRDCSGCSDCSYCKGCRGCRGCRDCSGCRGFLQNPERITSAKIGSRNDNTTIYWVDKDIQVVAGCFRGNLEQFEEKVNETHGDNEHGIAYKKFINKVKAYIYG